MAHLTLPDYNDGRIITVSDIESMTTEELLKGYVSINGTFTFPSTVKYPYIPCYLDSSTMVYPLQGKCLLTGPEYLLAKNQGAEIHVKSAFYIPPTIETKRVAGIEISTPVKPFSNIIQDLQSKR